MAGRTSRDYARYEAEFVTSGFTMRGFAAEKDIPVSALARYARKKDANGLNWYDKQTAYKANTTEKAYEILADRDAIQLAARMEQMLRINDRMLGIVEKQFPLWEDMIAMGKAPFTPKDVTVVIDQMRVLIGANASEVKPKEDRRFGFLGIVASNGSIDPAIAAQLEAAARPLLADGGSGKAAPRTVTESASTD